MSKILFLDIDGVLNTERQHDRCVNEKISPVDGFGYAFDPIAVANLKSIVEKTGANIKSLIKASGYTVRDIMEITGLSSEQAVYKWFRGDSIPSTETQLILCKVLDLDITELLVIDGEFDFFCSPDPERDAA